MGMMPGVSEHVPYSPDLDDPFLAPEAQRREELIFEGVVPEGISASDDSFATRQTKSPTSTKISFPAKPSPYRFDSDPTVSTDAWVFVSPGWPRMAGYISHHARERTPATPRKSRRRSSVVPWTAPAGHQAVRTKDDGLECPPPCGSLFTGGSAAKNWRRHVEDVLNPTQFSCPYEDGFACARRNGLDQHLVRMHGDRRFRCGVCGMTFASQMELNKHMEQHGGRRR